MKAVKEREVGARLDNNDTVAVNEVERISN